MASAPLVSIVVSNHNGWMLNILKPCLESILAINYPKFEVIVIDNDSSDKSVDFINTYFGSYASIKCVSNPENNYSLGLNIGIKNSKGKYVVFLNNDVILQPNSIKEAINVLESHNEIGLAQFKLINFFKRNRIDCIGETTDIYGNSVELGHDEIDEGQYSEIKEILCAAGSACIIRKNIINEVGYYDPEFVIGYEDLDFALRVWLKGYRVVIIPSAEVFHRRGASYSGESLELKKLSLKVKEHFYKNQIATILKNYSLKNLIKALPILLSTYFMMFVGEVFVRKDYKLAIIRLRAILWNIKRISYLMHQRRIVQKKIRSISDDVILRLMMENQLPKFFRLIKFFR
jgi:GT2 family glycosyltransferase